jgi:hypothetical protein
MPASLRLEKIWGLILKYPVETSTTWISIIPLLVFAYRRSPGDGAIRYVFYFLTINIVFQWVMLYQISLGMNNLFMANAYIVIRYLFVAAMFYSALRKKVHKDSVLVLSALFVFIAVIDWMVVGMHRSFMYTEVAECVFGGAFCLFYYSELMRHLTVPNLLRSRFFYVSSAFFVFYCAGLFLSPLSHYLNVAPYNLEMALFIMIPYVMESLLYLAISVGIAVAD